MKKTYLILAAACVAMLALTGCDVDDNAITGFLYEEVGGSYAVTDTHGNQLVFQRSQAEAIASMDDAAAERYLTAAFRQAYPASYSDPSTPLVVAAQERTDPEIRPTKTAQTAADALGMIPGFGGLASLIANGVLTIGAIWLGRNGSLWKKAAVSTVRGIDVFRDILDQTPQGEKIDQALKHSLKDQQLALGVWDKVDQLVRRIGTPTKQPIDLDD